MDKTAKAKDLLDNIIQRLEKIEKRQEDQIRKQSQTDEVLERLDTIHNRLERQNQKQNALDGKFSDVSYQLEQEKGLMRDQVQAAQNEILRRLTELQTKGEELAQTHGSFGQRAELLSYEGTETKDHKLDTALHKVADEVGRSVQGIKNELEHLKKYIKNSFDETQQHLSREILGSTGIASEQLHKDINDFKENTKAQLSAQTASMCDKLDNIEVLRRKMSTCEKKLTSIERTTEKHVKKGFGFDVNEFRSQPVEFFKKVYIYIFIYLVLFSAVWFAFRFSRWEDIISATQKSKRDIIAFIEKENQLVRDRIAGPLPQRKTYIFDFYVENFKQLVGSGREVPSLPWHINQFGTSVSGGVYFQYYDGDMQVWLVQGRNPREVGLEPKLYGRLKFKATITDTSGGLPDHVVGEETWTINDEYTKINGYWGVEAGVVSCDELIKRGYGEKEGYEFGALLIRYEISVL